MPRANPRGICMLQYIQYTNNSTVQIKFTKRVYWSINRHLFKKVKTGCIRSPSLLLHRKGDKLFSTCKSTGVISCTVIYSISNGQRVCRQCTCSVKCYCWESRAIKRKCVCTRHSANCGNNGRTIVIKVCQCKFYSV